MARQLHKLAESGQDGRQVEDILKVHPEWLDMPDKNGATPLVLAAKGGHAEIIEVLVKLGSMSLDTQDRHGNTPLFWAVKNGHIKTVETLVKLGSQVLDKPYTYGYTLLHWAAAKGHVAMVETLIRLGSRALNEVGSGYTPLEVAAAAGHAKVVDVLLGKLRSPEDIGRYGSLSLAAQYGHIGVVEVLVGRLGSEILDKPGSFGFTPLSAAVMGHNVVMVTHLRALGADITIDALQGPILIDKKYLIEALDPDFVREVRYRVYFARSLVQRLMREA